VGFDQRVAHFALRGRWIAGNDARGDDAVDVGFAELLLLGGAEGLGGEIGHAVGGAVEIAGGVAGDDFEGFAIDGIK